MAKNEPVASSGKVYPGDKGYKKPSERMGGPFDDYEVKDALRTLTEAEKISRNKALLRACKVEAKKQLDAAQNAVDSITEEESES